MINVKRKDKNTKRETKQGIPVIIGLALAIVLFVTLLNVETKMLADYEEGLVAVAVETVPEDTEITKENIAGYFTLETRKLTEIPDAALLNLEELLGTYAQTAIDKGSIITESMLGELQVNAVDTVLLGINMEEMEQSVVGTLRVGDQIDIYTVKTNREEEVIVEKAMTGITVDRSYTSAGAAITKEDTTSIAQYITIPIHKDAVGILYEALENRRVEIVKHFD